MILKIHFFSELPPDIQRKICQCGGEEVHGYAKGSYDFVQMFCKLCHLDRIVYWHKCSGCNDYFHKNPSTFSHPGWDWNDPKCWNCLEDNPDYVCTNYPEAVLKIIAAKGKRPPKNLKRRYTPEDLKDFDIFA